MTLVWLKVSSILLMVIFIGNCKNDFLDSHWKSPIPYQGSPPNSFSSLEKELNPSDCGKCHSKQFQEWSTSFHSRTVSDGFLWQLETMPFEKRKTCYSCHGPLSESFDTLESFLDGNGILKEETDQHMRPKFESFSKGLENPGLICASCHVREHTRYGPPPSTITSTKPGSNKPDSDFYLNSPLPHNGFIPKKEFENSQFCKNCHQSKPTGVLLNGKQLMETYSEWEQSDFAQKKISCQSCHMESRSHTWKGIHDKEFVRNALDVQFSFKKQKSTIEVIGSIESRKIGHSFPTYTIPQIHLELFVIQNGKKISIKQASIGRLVDSNLTQEYYDTRLKPGEKLVLISEFPLPNSGELTLGFQVDVDPDELYVRTFEENLIDQKELSSAARRSLISAIREKKSSKYNLFTSLKPVPLL